MIKVLTYGTYDLLHFGHIRLLERAKALGDYLIVGITADDFDKTRGKINVQQTLMERVEAVRSLGIADEIIIEEYEGQKIDDIKRYGVDIFTVGSDWQGVFDYLGEYCKVVYLDRTEGVSSSELRSETRALRLGVIGNGIHILKYIDECEVVNGISVSSVYTENTAILSKLEKKEVLVSESYDELLENCDAVYISSMPALHYEQIKKALMTGKHVLCESPIALKKAHSEELLKIAKEKELVLSDGIKTAYSTAFDRLMLLIKSGKIGEVVSVDSTCTSLRDLHSKENINYSKIWNSICGWGPTGLLPVFRVLGTDYKEKRIITRILDENSRFDAFTKMEFLYNNATATVKVAKGVKSEGELVISGTKGYVYVPSPWWKTDYFEIRFENPTDNKRYFYQLDGEGIRYELVSFVKSISQKQKNIYVEDDVTMAITEVIEDYYSGRDVTRI